MKNKNIWIPLLTSISYFFFSYVTFGPFSICNLMFLSRPKRVTFFFRSFIFNGTPCVLIRLHGFAKVWGLCRRRKFLGVTTPPKRIHISKNQLCSMEANSARGAHVQLYLNICPRDFSITIFIFIQNMFDHKEIVIIIQKSRLVVGLVGVCTLRVTSS